MTNTSRTYLLMQARYRGGDLTEHIRALRAGGASWHTISVRLSEATGVTANPETIRIWFSGDPSMARGKRADGAA